MKTEFDSLRHRARDVYRDAVAYARSEYRATIKRIDALEKSLGGSIAAQRSPWQPGERIGDFVAQVIPRDKPFTTPDLLALLKELDPDRDWPRKSVERYVRRLRNDGELLLVKLPRNGKPALYAFEGVEVEPFPFQGMTLADATEWALQDGPKTVTEIAVLTLENGYETAMDNRKLREEIAQVMREGKERFRKDGAKWGLISSR